VQRAGASLAARWLAKRIRKDYLFPPRHQEYQRILEVASERGYQAMALGEVLSASRQGAQQRVLALRHDVDTPNRKGVRLFLDLEKEFGATATYYFRLRTLGMTALVREILDCGSEVGYHFEEPASVAKQCRITSVQQLQEAENRRRIEEMMERNVQRVNAVLGVPIRSLCSHNDFYNRRLGIENYELLPTRLRQQFDILFEANDRSLMDLFGRVCTDVTTDLLLWRGDRSPVKAMREGVQRILVLTHPRQWHPAPAVNTLENLDRLLQELYYRALGV
jgi:hypothetical protein